MNDRRNKELACSVCLYAAAFGILAFSFFRAYRQQRPFLFGEDNPVYYLVWLLLGAALFISSEEQRSRRLWYAIIVMFALCAVFGENRLSSIDEGCHLDFIFCVAREHRLPTMFQSVNWDLVRETGVINTFYPDMRYEAVQTPLYYLLMAVPAMLIRNPRAVLFFCRLAGFVMWGASMLLGRRILQMLSDAGILRDYPAAVLMLQVFGIGPGVLIRCLFVSNECLTILLTLCILYTAMRMLTEGYANRLAAAGVLASAALFYTKTTGVFVIGALLLVMLYYRKIAAAVIAALAYALSAVPWFLRNLQLYGTATGMNEHIRIVIDRINPERENYNLLRQILTIFERKYFIPADVRTCTSFTELLNTGLSVLVIFVLGIFILRELLRLFGWVRKGWKFRYDIPEKHDYCLMVSAALVFVNLLMLAVSTRGTMLNTLIGRYLYFLIIPLCILFSDLVSAKQLHTYARAGAAVCLAVFWLDTMTFYAMDVGAQRLGMVPEESGCVTQSTESLV